MLVELGHYALVLAFALTLVVSVVPLWGALKGDGRLMAVATPVSVTVFFLVLVSFAVLTVAYVASDFSVVNVYENSHSAKPLLFKITGVWGNHEGSMLLWVLILVFFGALVGVFGGNLPDDLRATTLAVQGWISAGFLLFMLATSNPFNRYENPPIEGNDLNPILQDIGLAIHPPLLYVGYVGFLDHLLLCCRCADFGTYGCGLGPWVRPWTLLAWVLPDPRHRDGLLLGILRARLGRLVVLGSGRKRLLHAVACRHGAASFRDRYGKTRSAEGLDRAPGDLHLLALAAGHLPGPLGCADIVHAFATDPSRGVFILGLLCLFIGGSLSLFAWRAPLLKQGGLFAPISREGGLVLNNLFLTAATAAVLVGTLYPLVLDAITGEMISVGAPFFNLTFGPLMVPLLMAVPFGPILAWKRGDLLAASQRLYAAFGRCNC
jgi:cytochrome c-type biogenesis protein CcmF